MTLMKMPFSTTDASSPLSYILLRANQTLRRIPRVFTMLKQIAPIAMFILASGVAVRAANQASPSNSELLTNSEWLAVVGLIPPLLGAVYAVMDRIGRHGRYENAKIALELVKLKLEIEGIRKSQHLSLPEISVTPEDIAILQHPVGAHFDLFTPVSLRKSRWYRMTHNHPRWGRWFASSASAIAGFYGVALLGALFVVPYRESFGSIGFRIVGGVFYAVIGLLLVLLSVRIHRARKLALDDLHPAASPMPS